MNKFTLELMDKHGIEVGLAETIDIEEGEEFNGNSKAVYIGSKDLTGKWVELAGYTEEEAEKVITSGIYLFEHANAMHVNGEEKLTPITSYYVPYIVKDHLSFEPTLRWMPILTIGNKYKAIVEWLFGYEGKARYIYDTITLDITEENQSFSLTDVSLNEDKTKNDIKQNDAGEYFIDMYDIFGNRSYLKLDDPTDLDNYLLSVRLVAIQDAE